MFMEPQNTSISCFLADMMMTFFYKHTLNLKYNSSTDFDQTSSNNITFNTGQF